MDLISVFYIQKPLSFSKRAISAVYIVHKLQALANT